MEELKHELELKNREVTLIIQFFSQKNEQLAQQLEDLKLLNVELIKEKDQEIDRLQQLLYCKEDSYNQIIKNLKVDIDNKDQVIRNLSNPFYFLCHRSSIDFYENTS